MKGLYSRVNDRDAEIQFVIQEMVRKRFCNIVAFVNNVVGV